MTEQVAKLNEDKENKKAKEHFVEAARTLELISFDEVEALAETMFKDMPNDSAEKKHEIDRLKEVKDKFTAARATIKDARAKFNIK